MRVLLVTDDRVLYDSVGIAVSAPTQNGRVTILLQHAPMLAMLEAGELHIRQQDKVDSYSIKGGFLQVVDNRVTVLADSAKNHLEADAIAAEIARQHALVVVRRHTKDS